MDEAMRKKEKENGEKSTDNPATTEEDDASASGLMSAILNAEEAVVESQYTFDATAEILIVDHSKRKAEEQTLLYRFAENAMLTNIPEAEGAYIFDFKNNSAVIINEKEKTASTMSMTWMQKMMSKNTNAGLDINEDYQFTKTGRTKEVNGYTCDEYFFEDESKKETMEVWVTPDIDFDMETFSDNLSGFVGVNFGQMNNMGNGYMMEATTYKKGEKETFYQVQRFDKEQSTVELGNYEVQDMFSGN